MGITMTNDTSKNGKRLQVDRKNHRIDFRSIPSLPLGAIAGGLGLRRRGSRRWFVAVHVSASHTLTPKSVGPQVIQRYVQLWNSEHAFKRRLLDLAPNSPPQPFPLLSPHRFS